MNNHKYNKKYIFLSLIILLVAVIFLCLLIPIEKKRAYYNKWGKLAELAETDERAEYIIENEELYTDELIKLFYYDEESLDFVYNYPFHKDDYKSMSFTEEELNCKSVPALYMDDNRWAYETMGGEYIRQSGCMAVSLTMANLYLNHNGDIDPKKVALVTEENDNVGYFGGISNDGLQDVINKLGFNSELHDYTDGKNKIATVDIETIRDIVDSGRVCLACMFGDTFGAHAIIIREVTEDGKILLNDPASSENTDRAWDFDALESEIYFLWDLN